MKAAPATIPPTIPRMAAALRRIRLLACRRLARRRSGLLRSRRLLGRRGLLGGRPLLRGGASRFPRGPLPWSAYADRPLRGLAFRLLLEVPQGALQVVEDEAHGRVDPRRRG